MKLGVAGWVLKGVIDALEARGLPGKQALRSEPVRYSHLERPGVRVPIECERRIWNEMAEHDSSPTLGLELSEMTVFGSAPIFDYVAGSAPFAFDSLSVVNRYIALMHSRWNTTLELRNGQCIFTVQTDQPVATYYKPIDMFFGTLAGRMRTIAGKNLLKCAEFQHESFGWGSRYEEVLKASVGFDKPSNALIFSGEILNARVREADSEIHKLLLGHLVKIYLSFDTGLKGQKIYFELRDVLKQQLEKGHSPSIESSAKRLRLSKRSLQRRLQNIETSFDQIKRQVCVEMAEKKLSEGLSRDEAADSLGYSSGSSLKRAMDSVRTHRGLNPNIRN